MVQQLQYKVPDRNCSGGKQSSNRKLAIVRLSLLRISALLSLPTNCSATQKTARTEVLGDGTICVIPVEQTVSSSFGERGESVV